MFSLFVLYYLKMFLCFNLDVLFFVLSLILSLFLFFVCKIDF